jgi:transitional endoplasmic reticulum ATPase
VLVPTNVVPSERDMEYIGSRLDGLPVAAENRVRAVLFGARWADFKVESTVPKGPVLISPGTELLISKLKSQPVVERAVSYEDIGGLKPHLLRIREMIELPLRYPEVFERLGIDAPKGVLLYGPPGCGKTLIARAIAHETQANFFSVSGPEVIHKFCGESEAHLRKIFEEAGRKAPSIIFLDELDAIAPRRDQVVGEVEKRVVAQLLALMDGLSKRNKVIVIAATNLPNVLDPAFAPAGTVRPGDFHPDSRPPRPPGDLGDSQPRHAPRGKSRSRAPGRYHARLCRGGPGGPVPGIRHDLSAPHHARRGFWLGAHSLRPTGQT